MGLKEKASLYRIKTKPEKIIPEKFEISNFIFEIFNKLDIDYQIELSLISIANKFKTNKILINFLDEEKNIYKCLGIKGLPQSEKENFQFHFDDPFLKELNKLVKIEDLIIDQSYRKYINQFLSNNFKIIFPLNYQNELKGFLALAGKINNEEFSNEDLKDLEIIGSIITSAILTTLNINNIKSDYENLKNENRTFKILLEEFRNVSLSEDIDEALNIFYHILKNIYKVEMANVLVKFENDIFKVKKSIGMSQESDKNFYIDLKTDEIINNITTIGEPMNIPDFENTEFFNRLSDEDKNNIKLFYVIPLKLGEKCFGIVNIFKITDIIDSLPLNLEKSLTIISYSILPYLLNEKN